MEPWPCLLPTVASRDKTCLQELLNDYHCYHLCLNFFSFYFAHPTVRLHILRMIMTPANVNLIAGSGVTFQTFLRQATNYSNYSL